MGYGVEQGRSNFMHRASMKVRRSMYGRLVSLINFHPVNSVLDVGVTSDQSCPESNFFEQLYPYKEHITALSDQDARWMEQVYPGLRFVPGDGKNLPFEDASFDLVFSSAVIEHVGSFEQQALFLKECYRVARKFVFITTPNRWYPIEFHTLLPVIHMLPKKTHRKILNLLSRCIGAYK